MTRTVYKQKGPSLAEILAALLYEFSGDREKAARYAERISNEQYQTAARVLRSGKPIWD